jgi:hypothetical protein
MNNLWRRKGKGKGKEDRNIQTRLGAVVSGTWYLLLLSQHDESAWECMNYSDLVEASPYIDCLSNPCRILGYSRLNFRNSERSAHGLPPLNGYIPQDR